MKFTAQSEFSKRFAKDKAHRALVMVVSRCTPVSDLTAANVGKVNLAKSIEGPLFAPSTVKFFCLPQATTGEHPVLVGCGCGNHRTWRHLRAPRQGWQPNDPDSRNMKRDNGVDQVRLQPNHQHLRLLHQILL
jgi:hypothetical protein